MFTNANLFGVLKNGEEDAIVQIKLDRDTQKIVNNHFTVLLEEYLSDNLEVIPFEGSYKPDNDQIFEIENYSINEDFINAVKATESVELFTPTVGNIKDLKFIFIGKIVDETLTIVFQKIKPDQYITNKGISLLAKNNTFRVISDIGISISSKVDLVYNDKKLYFKSYTCARQIFDLSVYYRTATDCEVDNFTKESSLSFVSKEYFVENADTWVRRKLSMISDIGVFEKFNVDQIIEIAADNDFELNTVGKGKSKKIIIPENKADMKSILKFLDEDIYKGYFSKNTYETNSKRRYRK